MQKIAEIGENGSGIPPAIWTQYFKAAFGKTTNAYVRTMFIENLLRSGLYDGFDVCIKLLSKREAAAILKGWMRGNTSLSDKVEKVILNARPDLKDYYLNDLSGGDGTGIS